MTESKISLKAVEIDYPNVFDILSRMSKTVYSFDYLTGLNLLKVIKKNYLLYKSSFPNQKIFLISELLYIQKFSSKMNRIISKGILYPDRINHLLRDIIMPITIIKNIELRFFPHKLRQTKLINRTKKANQYIENILCDEPPKEYNHIWNFQKLIDNKMLKDYVSMFEYGTTDIKGMNQLVDFHPPTRRNACRIPISIVLSLIMKDFNSENDLIKIEGFINSRTNGHRKPVVEILIPCPLCKKHMIHLPFTKFCNFIEQIDTTQKDKIKSNDKFIPDDQLHIVYLYNRIRQNTSNSNILKFICPNQECKYATMPFLFEVSTSCKDCIKQNITNYHKMICPSCNTHCCPICNKIESEHIGEQQICPQKKRVTQEERNEAKKNNIIYCPACDFVVHWDSGCPHLICPICKYHYCGNCEQHLNVNPETGSRYTHHCSNPGNADYVFRQAIDREHFIPEELRDIDYNPAICHDINKFWVYNYKNYKLKNKYENKKIINKKYKRNYIFNLKN